ncbi:MAG: energy transducer TonB [Desulfobacteraceae bacterium]|nr:energy transducer TonB [Desulfobacteraceae bacterium]
MAAYPNGIKALHRSMRGIWAWSALAALAMNLVLFMLMPCLIYRNAQKPAYEELISNVRVVHIKRLETPLIRKEAEHVPKPPEEKAKQMKPALKNNVKFDFKLPIELNPGITPGPVSLNLPEIQTLTPASEHWKNDFVTAGDLDMPLTALVRSKPDFPFAAKRRGIEGWVRVKFIVNEQGNVENISIVEADPPGVFEQSVIRSLSTWRYQPVSVEGMPVKTRAETVIQFKLE